MSEAAAFELGVVRGISYGLFGPPGRFMPQLRALGSRLTRVFLSWHQIEPQPGVHDWSAVDALLGQLEPGDRLWVTVVSASRWATHQPTDFLPASLPRDAGAYQLFLGALMSRCNGKVAFWQCNNEPSNPGLWSGSAAEYAELAAIFARTVRQADPKARVVLGGCGFDVLGSTEDSEPRRFFDQVLANAGDAFDLFDVHLYDAPQRIPSHIEDARRMMAAHGIDRPIVVGEYGGPTLLGLPELDSVMQSVMAEALASGAPSLDSADLAQQEETPDRLAMRALYAQMSELPPALQMFMQNCPPMLEAKRHRIACREIVTRNLLAMASGARLTLAWNLAPEVPNYRDPFNMMGFLSDKLALMGYNHRDEIARREPAAEAFARFAELMRDATEVRRLETDLGIVAMEITRERGTLYAFWAEADPFAGEDELPRLVEWMWTEPSAQVVDIFGNAREMTPSVDHLSLGVSVTPLFVSATP
ncbi:MAG: hypothetical protein EOP22_10090 [Hyphomicrobiales bacterium]|nr:MAG: hypothetical protein EOP22_10090 [Hyphomicrobiales bacterium]